MLDKKQIIEILNEKLPSACDEIFMQALDIKHKYFGNKIFVRALIEFSNICKNACQYCGISCENKKLKRYRMQEAEIVSICQKVQKLGYQTVVLQSGEDDFFDETRICNLILRIKETTNLTVTLAIGEREKSEYQKFFNCGARRFLIKHETSDKNLYQKLHPKMSFENRINCLKNLKSIGFETGSGIMVGLPNQTIESIADDILLFSDLNVDMIGIGPYIKHPETQLFHQALTFPFSKDDFDMNFFLKKVIAIVRINNPKANLPVTTAFSTIDNKFGRRDAFQSGANVIMINHTAKRFKKLYEIYPNKFQDKEVENLSITDFNTGQNGLIFV